MAKVVEMSPIIEEEVTLEIDGIEIVTFANLCPFELIVGEVYQIELDLTILDEFIIKKVDWEEYKIHQEGNGLSYTLQGKLDIDNRALDAGGITFEIDSEFLMDYGYLHEQYVQIRVNRITVDFL
ncbi:hypothetical protein I6N90_05225 [Paenibacillus sp. GSMTC-2017]|uniref:hypothetical protein n=1 Tax=Paenibacillus sp. GSMTC-2017 TaxID=2794350 RepID=UPI0018D7FB8B|nr:hypothetical protein [Paenibacillus sp. GSMTC-2017]MBH5317210.1 hypothetical protein [Paenibacillus sp. GSMTC-2017]